jgi:uncharacterized membrane protein YqjE
MIINSLTNFLNLSLGFSTFLGLLIIAFSQSKLFQLLFRILVSIVLLGLLHGLVFLPVLLSLFCPWKLDVVHKDENNLLNNNKTNKDELSDSEDENEDTYVFYESSIDSNCPCDFCDRFK